MKKTLKTPFLKEKKLFSIKETRGFSFKVDKEEKSYGENRESHYVSI
jgi:hypothetical protein